MAQDRTSGAPVALTLDGYHLVALHPEAWTLRHRDYSSIQEMSEGSSVQRIAWRHPEPGALDTVGVRKVTIALDVAHARDSVGPLVDRILAGPGPHRAVTWKRETVAYVSDGATATYRLPWPLAQHALDATGAQLTPPAGHPWSGYEPEARVGAAGAVLALDSVSQATWDAGQPPADTIWYLADSPYARLAAAPAQGEVLYLSVVPELTVLSGPPSERQYRTPLREPRRIELVEA